MNPELRFSAPETLRAMAGAGRALGRRQNQDGHWNFELEADATIPAEYVLLEHDMDRITPEWQQRIGVYLRRIQGEHGGWPMFRAGVFNLSASVNVSPRIQLALFGAIPVQEIGRQVDGSANLAQMAVSEAGQTAQLVQELSGSVAKIG